MVTVHALAAAGIAHVASTRLAPSHDGWFCRSDAMVLGSAFCLAVLSHGVLDGLKHGYPLRSAPDVVVAAVMATAWCLCVRRRFLFLFAAVFFASFMPDVVDLGPGMLRSATGVSTPTAGAAAVFPWHWPDGSGSVYPMSSTAPDRTRILDTGRNIVISWVNHLIIIAFATTGIFMNPGVLRFHRERTKPHEKPCGDHSCFEARG